VPPVKRLTTTTLEVTMTKSHSGCTPKCGPDHIFVMFGATGDLAAQVRSGLSISPSPVFCPRTTGHRLFA